MPPLPLTPGALAGALLFSLLWVAAAARLVASLKLRRGLQTAYTRKLFHFLIITAAAGVHWTWGVAAVVLFTLVLAAWIAPAVLRGDGDPLYEALARPSDSPHRTRFIIIPFLTTALGGATAHLLFAPFAPVGYLVCAWGDGVAEPVGARWGRHGYAVPSLFGVAARRSLEGSLAVLVAGSLAAFCGLLGQGIAPPAALGVALACGAVATGVEAVSHHGTDNFSLQVASAGVAWLLLG